jgi:hypothetical protein
MGKDAVESEKVDEIRRSRPYHGDFGGCERARVRVR